MIKNKQRQKGFTTIELLVVIAVIAVLAAGVIAAANRMRNQAQQQQARSILNEVGSVEEQIASESAGDYEQGAGTDGLINSSNDERLRELQTRLQNQVDNSINLYVITANSNQDFAASIPRPNGDGAFCIDDDGDSRGYSTGNTATGVISGGNCQGTNNSA